MTEIEIYSKKSETHLRMAVRCLEQGRLHNAKRNFDIAAEYGAPEEIVQEYYGQVLRLQDKLEQAMEVYNRLLYKKESNPTVHYQMATIYRTLGNRRAALENYRAVLRLTNDTLLRALTVRDIFQLKGFPEKTMERMIELTLAEEKLQKCPEPFDQMRGTAVILMLKKRYRESFLLFRDLLMQAPEYAELYRDLSLLHIENGNYRLAAFTLRKALMLLKKDRELQWLSAWTFWKIGNYAQCAAVLRRMSGHGNRNAAVLVNLGNVQQLAGHKVSAIRSYRQALLVKKDYFPALFNLACLYHETGTLDRALALYREALDQAPDNASVLYNMGLLFFESGDLNESVRLLRRCVQLRPGFEPAQQALGYIRITRRCYPDDGPEETIHSRNAVYWAGLGTAMAAGALILLKGWLS